MLFFKIFLNDLSKESFWTSTEEGASYAWRNNYTYPKGVVDLKTAPSNVVCIRKK